MRDKKQRNNSFGQDSLLDGLGEEGGIAGLGGIVEHGLPIFVGGLNPDGFGSVMFYVHTAMQQKHILLA